MRLFGIFISPAKRYARELGPWLRKSYGASPDYTEGQIRRAVSALRLDERYIAFGYAAFMSEEVFQSLGDRMPVRLGYQEARAKFARFLPRSKPSSSGPVQSMVDPSDVVFMDVHHN
jgi:hypothetical protein